MPYLSWEMLEIINIECMNSSCPYDNLNRHIASSDRRFDNVDTAVEQLDIRLKKAEASR